MDKFHAININASVTDYNNRLADGTLRTKVEQLDQYHIAIPKMKGGKPVQRHSTKGTQAVPHSSVSSETLIPEITIKNAEPNCVQQQTSEDRVQALNYSS